MATVTSRVPPADRRGVAAAIRARAANEPGVTARSMPALLRALRRNRLVVAFEGHRVVGWFLSEPCGPGVHELGFIFVDPQHRSDALFVDLINAGIALEPRAVAVTFRPEFAQWLIRAKGFRGATLAEVSRVSRGWFLWRRATPSRLVTAIRRTSSAEPLYLVYEELAQPVAGELSRVVAG